MSAEHDTQGTIWLLSPKRNQSADEGGLDTVSSPGILAPDLFNRLRRYKLFLNVIFLRLVMVIVGVEYGTSMSNLWKRPYQRQ